MTGENLLQLAKKLPGEHYILGAKVPKSNTSWKGPWDCTEFITWIIFRISGKLYGCNNNLENPALANTYAVYWRDNAAANNGCIPNCRRLVETPTGAFRRGRCLHRPHEATQSDNLECTRQ